MSGKPCAEGCQCGRHHRYQWPAPISYVLTSKARAELARWDRWDQQRAAEDEASARAGGSE